MEHQRHRAPDRHRRRTLVLAVLVGLVIGAAAAGIGWWLDTDPQSPSTSPSGLAVTTAPLARADRTSRSEETRNEMAMPSAANADPTDSAEPVLLLGDSLAVGIAPYVDAGLGERTLTVDAAEGRGTATSVSLLTPYAASSAPDWIVSLGTNDNTEEFGANARALMDLAGPDRCVVWFDVWRAATDESINATLNDLAADNPNLHLIPWHDTSAMHTEWFSGSDVHPASEGYAVRGQMAIDAVHEYCG
ncbi:MAG: hypothetical protein ACJ74E_00715 [Actinomycetes bacterium]